MEYILSQFDSNRNERVICYGGRSLRGNETKWSVTDREGLALVEAVKHYHPYLANRHFEVFTDHISLKWLKTIKLATGRLSRWSFLLQSYNFTITHRPGIKNQNADALSKRTYETEEESTSAVPDLDDEEIRAKVLVPAEETTHSAAAAKIQNLEIYAQPTIPAIVILQYSQEPITSAGCHDTNDEEIIQLAFTPKIEEENVHTLPSLQWQCKDLRPV